MAPNGFPDHRWTIPNPTNWRFERMSRTAAEAKLAEIASTERSIVVARERVLRTIEARQQTIRDRWRVAFAQEMAEAEAEVTALTKEAARLGRLAAKCQNKQAFIREQMASVEMQHERVG